MRAEPAPQESADSPQAPSAARLAVIGALALALEIPGALSGIIGTSIFRSLGVSLTALSLFAIPQIPQGLRWLWAAWVDNRTLGPARLGRRRSWILGCAFAALLVHLVTAAVLPAPETLLAIVLLFTLAQLVLATGEIAADAYTVEHLPAGRRGMGAGIVGIGKELGQLLSIVGLALIYRAAGWSAALTAAGLLVLLLALPTLALPERPRPAVAARVQASVWRFFRHASWAPVLLVLFAANFSRSIFVAIFGAFLVDKGLSIGEIGLVAGAANTVGAVVAMTLGALSIQRFGIKRTATAMIPISLLAVVGVFWLVLAPAPSLLEVILVIGWITLLTTPITLCVLAARLGWTSEGQVGTDYTVQASAYFLGYGLAVAVAGPLADLLGWTGFFALQAALMLASTIAFVALFDPISAQMARWRAFVAQQDAARPAATDEIEALTTAD